jgi:hypothetical protein
MHNKMNVLTDTPAFQVQRGVRARVDMLTCHTRVNTESHQRHLAPAQDAVADVAGELSPHCERGGGGVCLESVHACDVRELTLSQLDQELVFVGMAYDAQRGEVRACCARVRVYACVILCAFVRVHKHNARS